MVEAVLLWFFNMVKLVIATALPNLSKGGQEVLRILRRSVLRREQLADGLGENFGKDLASF